MSKEGELLKFLSEPVPPGGTTDWANWRARWTKYGPEYSHVLIHALEQGGETQQYSALVGLRFMGFTAFADDSNGDWIYRVTSPDGSEMAIKPKIAPKRD